MYIYIIYRLTHSVNLQSTLLFQVFSWEHPQQILGLQPALNFWPWRLWENPEIWRDVFGINHQNSVVLKMHMSNNLNWFHTPSSKMCCFLSLKMDLTWNRFFIQRTMFSTKKKISLPSRTGIPGWDFLSSLSKTMVTSGMGKGSIPAVRAQKGF